MRASWTTRRRSSPRSAPRIPITSGCCRPTCATGSRRASVAAQPASPPIASLAGYSERNSVRIGAGSAAARASSRVSHRSPGDFGARRPRAHGDALRQDRQPEMRETVLDRRELVARGDRRREARAAMRDDVGVDRRLRAGSTGRPRCRPRAASRTGSRRRARCTSTRTARCGSAFRGRGDGSSAMRSVAPRDAIARRRDSRRSVARARVQIVAPRSISACV